MPSSVLRASSSWKRKVDADSSSANGSPSVEPNVAGGSVPTISSGVGPAGAAGASGAGPVGVGRAVEDGVATSATFSAFSARTMRCINCARAVMSSTPSSTSVGRPASSAIF